MDPTSRAEINKYADKITDYSLASGMTRAKACISQLTSAERNYFLQVVAGNPPSYDSGLEKSILNKICQIDSTAPIADKDAGKNILQRTSSNISRVMQNTLGDRKSTKAVITELQSIDKMKSLRNPDRDAQNQFMSAEAFSVTLKERLQLYGDRQVDCKNEYRLFGLKPGASPEAVDKALVEYMNKHTNKNDRNIGENSYSRILMLQEAKTIFGKDVTLAEANTIYTGSNQPKKYEKAMKSLTILAADNPDFPGIMKSIEKKLRSINRADL